MPFGQIDASWVLADGKVFMNNKNGCIEFIMVRHGKQGAGDGIWKPFSSLNEQGHKDAAWAAEKLGDLYKPGHFEGCYVSPLTRAMQTAWAIAPSTAWNIEPKLAPSLEQMNTLDQAMARSPDSKVASLIDMDEVVGSGYIQGIFDRFRSGLEDIAKRHMPQPEETKAILIVSHMPAVSGVAHQMSDAGWQAVDPRSQFREDGTTELVRPGEIVTLAVTFDDESKFVYKSHNIIGR